MEILGSIVDENIHAAFAHGPDEPVKESLTVQDTDVAYAYNISSALQKIQQEEWNVDVFWPRNMAFKKEAAERVETIRKRAKEVFEPVNGHNWCFYKEEGLRGHIPRLLAGGSEQGMALVLEFLDGVERNKFSSDTKSGSSGQN